MTTPAQGSDRWKDRRWLAAALGVAIVCFPIAGAVGLTLLVEGFVRRPAGVLPLALWYLAVLALATVVFVAADRLARRALPLRVLLRMGLAFPGRPPRRLAVAWRAGSVRDLDRRVADARAHGVADEPTQAAERIVTLAAAMSAHDRTTRGHSERVRALTDMISDELRLGAADRDRLRWAALLHDVGKLAVHPEVLNKSGALDEQEWEQVRLHPLEGAKLTAPLAPWLGQWASTIAEHHERFDGKGYPAGLAGREISHGGRIVAVADAYDVMTAARSYKAPVGPAAARQELAACAGSQFDPEVVRAFLAVSIWRLRVAAPLSWLGSVGGPRLGALGHAGAGAGGAGAGAGGGGSVGGGAPAAGAGGAGDAGGGGGAGGVPQGVPVGDGSSGSSSTTTTTAGVPGSPSTTTTTTLPGGGGTTTTTTTLPGGGTTTTTTTTVPGGGTTTTTTTTVPSAGQPAAPTGVQATGGCQVIVLGPEITVTWTPSTSPAVTSYVVLRSGDGGSSWSAVGTTPASGTSFTDSGVASGRTYWYEVEAVAPGGTAASGAASGESFCLL